MCRRLPIHIHDPASTYTTVYLPSDKVCTVFVCTLFIVVHYVYADDADDVIRIVTYSLVVY